MPAIKPTEEKLQGDGWAMVHPEYSRRWSALLAVLPAGKVVGFPSMKRGSLVPFVPTYPACSNQFEPKALSIFRFQSCAYGRLKFLSSVNSVIGCANVPLNGLLPLYGSEKLGRLICGVCRYGGALMGVCSGPPWPVLYGS